MSDAHKQLQISDLELPAKRGRPKSGNALSNAEKQRLYRLRKNGRSLLFTAAELSTIHSALTHFAEYGKSDHSHAELALLMARVSNVLDGFS